MKYLIALSFLFFITPGKSFSQNRITPQQLQKTNWQSDDKSTTLKFLNESQVVRVKGNKELMANYKVGNNQVILSNGFVTIPLTYSNGVLKGYLTAGAGEIILRKIK
jgi:hypothetical protein